MKQTICSDRELARLCLELSLFLRAGMDPGTGLLLMGEKTEDTALASALKAMAEEMSFGIPLSRAAEQSGIFPADAVAMMKIGETTGRTEEAVTSLAAFYRRRESATERIRSAILYPSVLLVVMLAVIVLLLTQVLPIFNEVYTSFGGPMTGLAGALLVFGQALRKILPVLVIAIAVLAAVALILLKKGVFRSLFAKNKIAVGFRTAHFAEALHMAIASGLSTEDAVETAGQILGNPDEVTACLRLLDEGKSLAGAIGETALLPPTECRLLDLALISGATEAASREIADRLNHDADAALEQLISRIEPALVLVTSLLVGGILLSVMLPLTGLMTGLG